MNQDEVDPKLAFTVTTVWCEERVSCPHPDILASWAAGGLERGAAEFVAFHLRESKCPYCNSVVDDLGAHEDAARKGVLHDLRDRLLRSTAAELRRART